MNFPLGNPASNTVRYMDLFPARSEPLRRSHVPRSQHLKSPLLRSRFIFPESLKFLELDPKYSDETWIEIRCNAIAQDIDDNRDLLLPIMKRFGWIAIKPSVGSPTPEFQGRRVYVLPPPESLDHLSCVVYAILPWPVHDALEKDLEEFEKGAQFLTVNGLKEYVRVKDSEVAVIGPVEFKKSRQRYLKKWEEANSKMLSKKTSGNDSTQRNAVKEETKAPNKIQRIPTTSDNFQQFETLARTIDETCISQSRSSEQYESQSHLSLKEDNPHCKLDCEQAGKQPHHKMKIIHEHKEPRVSPVGSDIHSYGSSLYSPILSSSGYSERMQDSTKSFPVRVFPDLSVLIAELDALQCVELPDNSEAILIPQYLNRKIADDEKILE